MLDSKYTEYLFQSLNPKFLLNFLSVGLRGGAALAQSVHLSSLSHDRYFIGFHFDKNRKKLSFLSLSPHGPRCPPPMPNPLTHEVRMDEVRGSSPGGAVGSIVADTAVGPPVGIGTARRAGTSPGSPAPRPIRSHGTGTFLLFFSSIYCFNYLIPNRFVVRYLKLCNIFLPCI